MGAVYEAHHIGLERSCAVKVLPDLMASDADAVQRFFREARATAQLNHPSVVGIHDVGWDGRQPYIAMELIAGKGLDVVLALEKPLDEAYVLDVAIQAASGLAAAHEKGIVHRDVKPANLMITDSGVLKVMDFGLARLLEGGGQISRSGMVVGTLQFMSPEQASAEPVDERTDVYSLGATIYTLLAGVPPFDAPTAAALLIRTVQEEAPELDQLRSGLSPALVAVVRRMMAKSPDRRYPSMTECLQDLERVARGEAPLAGMSRAQAVLGQLRHRGGRIGAAILFVVVAIAVARWSVDPVGDPSVAGSGSEVPPPVTDPAEDQAFGALEALLRSDAAPAARLVAVDSFLERFPRASAERQRFAFGWKLKLDKLVGAGSDPHADPASLAARAAERAYAELGAQLDAAGQAGRYAEAIAIADAFLAVHGDSVLAPAMRARRAELERLSSAITPPPSAFDAAARELDDALARGELDRAIAAYRKLEALDRDRARSAHERVARHLKSELQQAIRNGQRDGVERLLPALETFDPATRLQGVEWLAQRDGLVQLGQELDLAVQRGDYDRAAHLLERYKAAGASAEAIAKVEPRVEALRSGASQARAEADLARAVERRDLAEIEAALAALERVAPALARAQAQLHGPLLAQLRSLVAERETARLRPALDALHGAVTEAVTRDWADASTTFARARKRLEAPGDPALAPEVAEYRRHVELLEGLRAGLAQVVAAAGLEGRNGSDVFGDRFPEGKIAAVRDGAIVLTIRDAQVPVPVNRLLPLDVYRLGRLCSWKAPLTSLAACTVLAYHEHRFEARGVAARAKLGETELGPVLRKFLGAEFPTGSLEQSWRDRAVQRSVAEGTITQLVPTEFETLLVQHPKKAFAIDAGGAEGQGVLFPCVDGAQTIDATWQVPALRLPVDESRLSILVRFQRLDEEQQPVELRYIEIALRLDEPMLEVLRRDPETGVQSRDVGALPTKGAVPGNGGEVRLGVRLDRAEKHLVITGTVAGVELTFKPYPFADRSLLGFGVASIGHATRLKLLELRRGR